MPKVSILIPAFRPQYLDLAIASALAQSFDDYELLISDDSDEDLVASVVSKWQDPRIRYFKNPNRQQPGANRDHLLSQAKGKYVKFLFDDDFLLPHSLETLVNAAAETSSQLVFHARLHVDQRGCVLAAPQHIAPGTRETILRRDFLARMLGTTENFVGEPTCILFEAAAFRKLKTPFAIAGFPMRFLTDVSLYINFAASGGKITGVGTIGAAFRHHPEQTSTQSFVAFSAGLFEWELFLRWAVDTGDLDQERYAPALAPVHANYRQFAKDFPELRPFIDLGGEPGPEGFLSDEFRGLLTDAYQTIDQRRRARLAGRSP